MKRRAKNTSATRTARPLREPRTMPVIFLVERRFECVVAEAGVVEVGVGVDVVSVVVDSAVDRTSSEVVVCENTVEDASD